MRARWRWGVVGLVLAAATAGAAEKPLVAVVFSEASYRKSPGGEGRGARRFLETVTTALDTAGVAAARLKDSDVAAGRLAPYAMAVFPYSFVWPKDVVAGVKAYVEGGGKAFFFYSVPAELAALIGVEKGTWESREPRPYYQTIRLRQDLLVPGGLPPVVQQNSHNIYTVRPATDVADILGEWAGPDGQPLGIPALVVTRRGAIMGHVLTGGDVANKGRMLRAVIGLLVPEVWNRAWARSSAEAERVGPLESYAALGERIQAARVPRSNRREAEERVARAREELATARALAEGAPAGPPQEWMDDAAHAAALARIADDPAMQPLVRSCRTAAALNAVHRAQALGAEAFALSSPERRDEFRGTWIHTAYGVGDWGWRKSIRHLADHGFNAIVPNMLWAGLAHYPSDVLPVAPQVQEQGDQIAECLRWCRRYGVELHVWKVNYNLGHAPTDFVARLREEGRLQRDRSGAEIAWLCPSDPRNFALERDSMLEVVRRYAVDGIHFDYIRYPHSRACFCEGCRFRFEKALGRKVAHWPDDVLREPLKDRFAEWRQDQITRLVRAVATEARRLRPGVLVSAAVFGAWEQARFSVGQDWKRWVEEGLLDFVCPMDYTTDAEKLADLVGRQVQWVQGRVPLYAGIGAWRVPDAPGLLDQLERARRLGADGFVCFHYNDRDFTDRRLPMLHLSHTAHATRPPHRAPRVSFLLPPGAPELPRLGYRAGTEVEMRVALRAEGNYARPVRRASGRLTVETTGGEEVQRLGRVRSGDEPLAARLRLPAGRYRLVVRGRASFGWFRSERFVARSRPFDVVGEAAVEAAAAARRPPQFTGAGLRVGVVAGGYGSDALLTALRAVVGIEARPLADATAEFLRPCQVVVYPQPRQPDATTPAVAEALRRHVAAGGGLLATHDAPGFRTHPVLIPEVCPGGRQRIEGTTWWASAEHPVTRGVPIGRGVPHSYYDFIALREGPLGKAIAEGLRVGREGGASQAGPAVVCGQYGRGRYVACGLALGINREDGERPPTGAELALLLNAVRWLGRQ